MLRVLFILLFSFYENPSIGQSPLVSDELTVDVQKTTELVFSSTIVNYKVGSSDVKVRKSADNILSLTASVSKFNSSSLLVQTIKGYFDFNVSFKHQHEDSKIEIDDSKAIFLARDIEHPMPIVKRDLAKSSIGNNKVPTESPISKLAIECSKRVAQKNRNILTVGAIKNKIFFYLNGIYSKGDYLYVSTSIDNQSNSPYAIEFYKFLVHDINVKTRKTSFDYKEPIFIQNNDLKTVYPDKMVKHVFVFDKFEISQEKGFTVEAWEERGKRHIHFEVLGERILAAKNIL